MTCPDCKGTGVYRGLLREEPCPTCQTDPIDLPSRVVMRSSAEVEAEYGLRPGSLAPRPEPMAATSEQVEDLGTMLRALAEREYGMEPGTLEVRKIDNPDGITMPPGQIIKIGGKLEPVAEVVAEFQKERKLAVDREFEQEFYGEKPLEPVAQDADGQVKPIDEIVAQKLGKTASMRLYRLARKLEASEEARRVFFGVDVGTEPSKTVRAIVRVEPNGRMTVEEILPEETGGYVPNPALRPVKPFNVAASLELRERLIQRHRLLDRTRRPARAGPPPVAEARSATRRAAAIRVDRTEGESRGVSMADFGLIRPFDIDDGQLDGLSPQDCFVLGYELAQIDALLETGEAISRPVHSKNADRIRWACGNAGRGFRLSWMPEDLSEEWMHLEVHPPG